MNVGMNAKNTLSITGYDIVQQMTRNYKMYQDNLFGDWSEVHVPVFKISPKTHAYSVQSVDFQKYYNRRSSKAAVFLSIQRFISLQTKFKQRH